MKVLNFVKYFPCVGVLITHINSIIIIKINKEDDKKLLEAMNLFMAYIMVIFSYKYMNLQIYCAALINYAQIFI